MKKLALLILLTFAFLLSVRAQKTDTLQYKYVHQSLYRYGGYFIKGSERMTFAQIAHEFDGSALGMSAYLKAKKTRKVSNIFRYASLLTSLTTLAVIGRNPSNKNIYFALLGGQLALGVGSAWYGNESARYLDEAIWLRNKDLLFPVR